MAIAYIFKEKIKYGNKKDCWVVGICEVFSQYIYNMGGYRMRDSTSISINNTARYHSYSPDPRIWRGGQRTQGYNGIGYFRKIVYNSRMGDFLKTKEEADAIIQGVVRTKQSIVLDIIPAGNGVNKKAKTVSFFPQIQRPVMVPIQTTYWKNGRGINGVNFATKFNTEIISHIANLSDISKQNIRLSDNTRSHYTLTQKCRFADYPKPFDNIHKCISGLKKIFPRANYKVR